MLQGREIYLIEERLIKLTEEDKKKYIGAVKTLEEIFDKYEQG